MLKNLVIIVSVTVVPNLPLSFTKTRSVHTRFERFEQLKKTIATVREKIPNNTIILSECSDLSPEEELYLRLACDKFINSYNDEEARRHVHSIHKGEGEQQLTRQALENIKLDKFDNIFKICGRYFLNENFDYEKFVNDRNVITIKDDHMCTMLYKVSKNHFNSYKEFIMNEKAFERGEMFEKVMLNNYFINTQYNHHDKLGVEGMVSLFKHVYSM